MSQYGEEAGLNDRVLDALTEHGVETVGQLMDLFVAGESKMIKDIAGFGAAAMDDTREDAARRRSAGRVVAGRSVDHHDGGPHHLQPGPARRALVRQRGAGSQGRGRGRGALLQASRSRGDCRGRRQHQGPGLRIRHAIGHYDRRQRHSGAGREGRDSGADDAGG